VRILSTDGEFHSFRRQAQRWVEAGEVELTLVETDRRRLRRAVHHGRPAGPTT
jgi:hypothetical protein